MIELADGTPALLVTGYQESRAALADTRLSRQLPSAATMLPLPEDIRTRMIDYEKRTPTFNTMDPPEHTRYRRLLVGQFTVRRMRALEPRIRTLVNSCIDTMLKKGPVVDLVQEFALPIPSQVICELLGVPLDARSDFERRNPEDDLISALARPDGSSGLSDDEIAGVANLMVVAGHESTANMLSLGTFLLLENPDQIEAVRDPERVQPAVEELLRYLTITHLGLMRIAREDFELGGVPVPEGTLVVVAVNQANRDPGQFPEPAGLDLTRQAGHHLAFGHGIHQCIGQHLARLEMVVGYAELFRRIPTLRLAVPPEEVPLRSAMAVYGTHQLPVTWDV
ncbi:cytochrome P450 [Micromonospora sp. NPDC005171]|uniref:cytochrome P450 n=1 Tax=Micromonospora sp. NPDC005171 TaxID=3156866 RepID=UPI0033B6546B